MQHPIKGVECPFFFFFGGSVGVCVRRMRLLRWLLFLGGGEGVGGKEAKGAKGGRRKREGKQKDIQGDKD